LSRHWFTSYLTEYYSKGKKLGLDLGCDKRNYHKFYRCEYVGVDLPKGHSSRDWQNENSVDILRPDIFGSGTKLPFHDKSFDFITCYSVIPYVEEIDDFLNEMYRVLQPKGIAVVIIMNLRGLALHPNEYHPNKYNSKKLGEKLSEHGFKSIKHKNLKAALFSKYFDATSVYAYSIVSPTK